MSSPRETKTSTTDASSSAVRPAHQSSPFSRRTLFWVVGVSAVSLVAALFATAWDSEAPAEVEPSAYSESAIGHGALVATLRRLAIPVHVSRSRTAQKADTRGVLVVAEPWPWVTDETEASWKALAESDVPAALFVLPKRRGTADPDAPRFLGSVELVARASVQDVLDDLGSDAICERIGSATNWRGGGFSSTPTLEDPQLVVGGDIEPWIECDEGVLLGRLLEPAAGNSRRDFVHLVLSDPDLLSNHGLGRGSNAALALEILDRLRAGTTDGSVVFDESVHGYRGTDSFLAELARFPLVLLTVQAILCALVIGWSGLPRFGVPRPERPPLGQDKEQLLDNSARLISSRGRSASMLLPYWQDTLHAVTRQLCPGEATLDPDRRVEQLRSLGVRRGVDTDLQELSERVHRLFAHRQAPAGEVIAAAREIHAWRATMLGERP